MAKLELKRLKSIQAEAKVKRMKLDKVAVAKAKAAITNQPELASVGSSFEMGAEVQDSQAPHESHDMRHVACDSAAVIFCDTCGKWSRRNSHSQLTEVCSGVCGWKGGRELLRHGIMPVQGARLPPSAKRRK